MRKGGAGSGASAGGFWRGLWRRASVAALLLAAAPGRAPAQEPHPEERNARVEELERRFLQRLGEALELDDVGRRRLGDALSETRGERRRNAERRRALRAELAEAATAPRPDPARIDRLLEEWGEIQVREAEISREEQRRLAGFLTPVQRARFLYLRQRFLQAASEAGGPRDEADRPGRRRPAAREGARRGP